MGILRVCRPWYLRGAEVCGGLGGMARGWGGTTILDDVSALIEGAELDVVVTLWLRDRARSSCENDSAVDELCGEW